MENPNQTVKLEDGRILGYHEYGAADGKPVLFFHGGGAGSGLFAQILEPAALQMGIRIIAPDRPGIGASDYQANRTIAKWPKDVVELANMLQFSKFSIISVSAGSAYAFACASQIPERISQIAIVSGLCPPDLTYPQKEIILPSRFMFTLAKLNCSFLFKLILKQIKNTLENKSDRFFASAAKRSIETEKKIMLDPEYQEILTVSALAAFHKGIEGPMTDLKLCFGDWGFKLNGIFTGINFWHGDQDLSAPVSMVKYVAKILPDSTMKIFVNEGHTSVFYLHHREILENILAG